jgi:outer membrane autotransporter protein
MPSRKTISSLLKTAVLTSSAFLTAGSAQAVLSGGGVVFQTPPASFSGGIASVNPQPGEPPITVNVDDNSSYFTQLVNVMAEIAEYEGLSQSATIYQNLQVPPPPPAVGPYIPGVRFSIKDGSEIGNIITDASSGRAEMRVEGGKIYGTVGSSTYPLNYTSASGPDNSRLDFLSDVYITAFDHNATTNNRSTPTNYTVGFHGNSNISQYSIVYGGNPTLDISKASTMTIGIFDASSAGSVTILTSPATTFTANRIVISQPQYSPIIFELTEFPQFGIANFFTTNGLIVTDSDNNPIIFTKLQTPLFLSGNSFFDYEIIPSTDSKNPGAINIVPTRGFVAKLQADGLLPQAMQTAQEIEEFTNIVSSEMGSVNLAHLLEIGYMPPHEAVESVSRIAEGPFNGAVGDVISGTAHAFSSVISDVGHGIVDMFDTLFGQEDSLGVAAGDEINYSKKTGVWVHGLLGNSNQKTRSGASGFKTNMHAGIIGTNVALNDNTMLGGAVSITKTNMKHKATKSGDKTTVETYALALYGNHQFTENWMMQGTVMAGKNFVNAKERHLVARRGVYLTGVSKSDNMSYHAELLGGYKYKATGNMILTPMAGAKFTTSTKSHAAQTGAGLHNRTVTSKPADIFAGTVGVRLDTAHKVSQTKILTGLKAFVDYDFIAKGAQNTMMMNGFSRPVISRGAKPSRTSYKLGGDITAHSGSMEYGIGYDVTLAKKYFGQQGSLKVKVNL